MRSCEYVWECGGVVSDLFVLLFVSFVFLVVFGYLLCVCFFLFLLELGLID